MLKILGTSFCKVRLQKYPWIYLLNGYSELLPERTMKNINCKGDLCKKENESLIIENKTGELNLEPYFNESQDKPLIPHLSKVESSKAADELELHEIKNDPSSLPTTTNKAKKSREYKIKVTPKMINSYKIKTVLAIHFSPTMVAWTLIDRNFTILDWNWQEWETEETKSHTLDLIKSVLDVIPVLPTANAYVIEAERVRLQASSKIKRMHIQHQLAASIMSCIQLKHNLQLESSQSKFLPDTMYVLHTNTTAKWFKLFIGGEAISTKNTMERLLDYKLNVNAMFKDKYMSNTDHVKDQISWPVLKALAFLYLVTKHDIRICETKEIPKIDLGSGEPVLLRIEAEKLGELLRTE